MVFGPVEIDAVAPHLLLVGQHVPVAGHLVKRVGFAVSAAVSIQIVALLVPDIGISKEKGVVGWSTTQDSNTPDASITFVAGDTYVYPVVKTGFWVTFNTDGGDYVAPQFRMEPLDLSTVTPTRSGYTFDGWYIDGQKVTSVSAEATVTAHWKANSKTEYTVIHWLENADDNEYSSKDIEIKSGTTGAKTAATAKSSKDEDYQGFTAQKIEQKTIAGDGSTIVNVYYKRNVYIVNFYANCKFKLDTQR